MSKIAVMMAKTAASIDSTRKISTMRIVVMVIRIVISRIEFRRILISMPCCFRPDDVNTDITCPHPTVLYAGLFFVVKREALSIPSTPVSIAVANKPSRHAEWFTV